MDVTIYSIPREGTKGVLDEIRQLEMYIKSRMETVEVELNRECAIRVSLELRGKKVSDKRKESIAVLQGQYEGLYDVLVRLSSAKS